VPEKGFKTMAGFSEIWDHFSGNSENFFVIIPANKTVGPANQDVEMYPFSAGGGITCNIINERGKFPCSHNLQTSSFCGG